LQKAKRRSNIVSKEEDYMRLCKICGIKLTLKNSVERRLLCIDCNRARVRAQHHKHKILNPLTPKTLEEKKERARAYYLKNKGAIVSRATLWNRENRHKHNLAGKTWRWKARLRMIDAYGGKCACCGETEPAFLTIDHINNDGYTKRLEGQGVGAMLYKDLERRGWPKDEYQLLCMNCNFAKGHFGSCPHKTKK